MFKKTLIAAIAFSFVGASFAQAQDWRPQHGQHKVEPRRPMPPHKLSATTAVIMASIIVGRRASVITTGGAIRKSAITSVYGLRAPARGQRWIKVDDQFLLITAATGLIVGVLAGR